MSVHRLSAIRGQVNGRVRLVLHGTNGFQPELMEQCIAARVTKINVKRLVLDDYYVHLHSEVTKVSHTTLIEQCVDKMIDLTIEWMKICGSAGKV